MPIVKEKQKTRVQVFNGGENSTDEPGVVTTPFASLLRNGYIDEVGKVKQRDGIARIGDNPDRLISQWSFNASSAVDDKTTNHGTATSVTYEDGKFGKAAQFNGSTSSIVVTADTSIDVNSMGPFVVTAWIYVSSDGENDVGRILDKTDNRSTPTLGYVLNVQEESASTFKLRFFVKYDGSTDAEVVTSTTISADTWYKIEAHHNSDDSADIYINGAIASYGTNTTGDGSPVDDSSQDLYIGNSADGTATFDGSMELIRIYDGARTADERELDKINGLHWYNVGSTIDTLFRARDVHIERLDGDQENWTVVDSGFTADLETNFVQAKDILFILNGTDNVFSMNTSEVFTDEGDTNTDPPKTTVGAWAQNNRLFLSGSKTESERDFVWFSNSLAPQTFDRATNVFKVRSGTGGAVKWLQPFKLNELVIYKSDSIFVLNMTGEIPLTDWSLQPVNTEIGCVAGRTVQDIGNDQVFLDNEGKVRLLSRTTFDKLRISVISGPIQSTLNTINIDAMSKACSVFIDGRYFLSFPSGTATENNTTVVWDTTAAAKLGKQDSGWSVITGDSWYPSVYSKYEFGDNKVRAAFADNRNLSLCYKVSGNNDNGKAITMEVAGPAHSLETRGTDKIWGPVHFVLNAGENTTVEAFAEIDNGGFESIGTISLNGDAPVLPIDLPFSLAGATTAEALKTIRQIGRGKICRVKIVHSDYNTTATYNEYELYAEERIPRA